jgi:outer membrane protein assembly factor BamB
VGSNGTIYIGSNDGYLYAVNDRGTYGEVFWRYYTGKRTDSSPVIGPGGTIYIGRDRVLDNTGAIYAINTGDALAASPWPMFHHDIRHTGK